MDRKSLTSRHVLLKEAVKLQDAMIEEVSYSGHIIVCGFRPSLSHFVSLLRLESLRLRPKIVIVSDLLPTEEEWETIAIYPEVHFMKKDPSRFSHLVKAGIKRCSRVVVISDGKIRYFLFVCFCFVLHEIPSPDFTESLSAEKADAEAILIAKNLQEEDDRVYEIVEIGDFPLFSLLFLFCLHWLHFHDSQPWKPMLNFWRPQQKSGKRM